jgi:hypothetical protein
MLPGELRVHGLYSGVRALKVIFGGYFSRLDWLKKW